MTTDLLSLYNSTLFSNIEKEDLHRLCNCLSVKTKEVACDDFVFCTGESVNLVYYILSGSMHIIDENFWGNRSIIETMSKDTLFGEAYVFSSMENYLVSVVAAEDSIILEIDPTKLFETCANKCMCHSMLIKNAFAIISEKTMRLTEKLGHVMQRTIREKLLFYLSVCALREKKTSFFIPYSRQQLADYLCIDRSALSHELSKLQKQGMIKYQKNHFELLNEHERIN